MKLTIKVDVNKLDKTRFTERSYTNKEGKEVTVREMSLEIVPLKPENEKVVFQNDTSELVKTHFITEQATKEERANKVNMPFVGEGLMWRNKGGSLSQDEMDKIRKMREDAQKVQNDFDGIDEIDPDLIPF